MRVIVPQYSYLHKKEMGDVTIPTLVQFSHMHGHSGFSLLSLVTTHDTLTSPCSEAYTAAL